MVCWAVSPLSPIPHVTASKYSEEDEIFRGQECGGSSTRPTQYRSFFNSLTLFGQLLNFPEDVKDSKWGREWAMQTLTWGLKFSCLISLHCSPEFLLQCWVPTVGDFEIRTFPQNAGLLLKAWKGLRLPSLPSVQCTVLCCKDRLSWKADLNLILPVRSAFQPSQPRKILLRPCASQNPRGPGEEGGKEVTWLAESLRTAASGKLRGVDSWCPVRHWWSVPSCHVKGSFLC